MVPTYDARGNLTAAGSVAYAHTAENRLTSASGVGTLAYDPLGRLQETALGVTTRFGYDGMAMIAEHNSSNQLTRRYVHGPGVDEPLVWYEGSGTTDRRWLHADERGSVIAVSNGSGAATIINSYDEYGIPGAANAGRFQYTGQARLPELGLYHYKARAYSPTLGRFLQTDPIGYGDGMNMYAYVDNDPVNWVDPTGLCGGLNESGDVVVCANIEFIWIQSGGGGGGSGGGGGGGGSGPSAEDIVVTARPQKEEPSVWERAGQCALDHYGIPAIAGAVGGTAVAIGQPMPGTKRFVMEGSSRGTSLAAMALRDVAPNAGPFRAPTGDFVGGRLTGRKLGWTLVKGGGKAAARWIPFVGWGLLAADAIYIGACTIARD